MLSSASPSSSRWTSPSSACSDDSRVTTTVVAAPCRRTGLSLKRPASPASNHSYCDDRDGEDCKDPARDAKKMKERAARKASGDQARAMENNVRWIAGVVETQNSQSRGNGNSAGLRGLKIDTAKIINSLVHNWMAKARIEAMSRPGGLEAFVAENVRIADEALLPGPLHRGPLINLTGKTCERMDSKSTLCKIHPDSGVHFLACHEKLVRDNLAENEKVLLNKLEQKRQRETKCDSRL